MREKHSVGATLAAACGRCKRYGKTGRRGRRPLRTHDKNHPPSGDRKGRPYEKHL